MESFEYLPFVSRGYLYTNLDSLLVYYRRGAVWTGKSLCSTDHKGTSPVVHPVSDYFDIVPYNEEGQKSIIVGMIVEPYGLSTQYRSWCLIWCRKLHVFPYSDGSPS